VLPRKNHLKKVDRTPKKMIFTAHPIESLRGIKGEYKVVHLIRHAQGQLMSVGITITRFFLTPSSL
jgi:hypothetical protein